jgi:methionine-S-sulfoxide reductase
VGYAGGEMPDPTYRRLGGHTETIQIDFDPTRIRYEELLAIFWQSHNPSSRRPRQYRSIVFYHDEAQRRQAELSRTAEAARRQDIIHTAIQPYRRFYRAEAYHQKYRLRREKDILAELQKIYPQDRDLTDSTAAARINGYLNGFGTAARLAAQMGQLGLSPEGQRRLREIHAWRQR